MGRIIVPRISIRHLLPPEPEIAVRLQPQYLHWQVGRYKERIVSGPGGLGRGRIWVPEREGEQHNLILTQTYDSLIPLYGLVGLGNYAVIGTGSAAPNPSQTGLVNEVARTDEDTVPPLSEDTEPTPGQAVFKRVREFTEDQVGGRNLTEWGFSPVGVPGGNLMCRELFRDGSGNPVVLTLAPDQRLRLVYNYSFSYTPAIGTAQDVSVNIAGLGVKTAKLFLSRTLSEISHVYLLSEWASNAYDWPNNTFYGVLASLTTPDPFAAPNVYASTEKLLRLVGTTQITRGRKINAITFAADEANVTWYGLAIVRRFPPNPPAGALFLAFNPGQEFAKGNRYKMVVNEWVLTWGP
jgi:hypothetical protein